MTGDLFRDGFILFFDVILWVIIGFRAGNLAYGRTVRKLRRRAVTTLLLLVPGMLLTAGKIAVSYSLWPDGWSRLQDKMLLDVPLLIMPLAAVLLFSVPRLLHAARRSAAEPGTPPDADSRRAASRPLLVVPLQLAAVGAAIDFYMANFTAVPLSAMSIVLPLVILAVAASALAFRQHRRQLRLAGPDWVKPKLWLRALRGLAIMLVVALGFTGWIELGSIGSRLPDRVSMAAGEMDYGGGVIPSSHNMDDMTGMASMDHGTDKAEDGVRTVSVAELKGPQSGEPDKRFTLTAEKKNVKLSSGAIVEAWTFNGQLPGPELRVRQGDLVEVTLFNKDVDAGVTLHWHGQDVPNGEDGVAGVTQDAVLPGQTYTYRFLANQAGTYWYHSHQASLDGVRKGLFGAIIVEPGQATDAGADAQSDAVADAHSGAVADTKLDATPAAEAAGFDTGNETKSDSASAEFEPEVLDIAVLAHNWETAGEPVEALGMYDTPMRRPVDPGTPVRLRLINTENDPISFYVAGTPFKVTAIDGTDLNAPTDLVNAKLKLAAGGRYDISFPMPDAPVLLQEEGDHEGGASLILGGDGQDELPEVVHGAIFDPLTYGSEADTPFSSDSRFDRHFELVIDKKLGFFDGGFKYVYTLNGKLFPDTPMFSVKEGDLVKTTIINRSSGNHPMHLHGHHMLVLSRDGKPSTGSPWWTDTLNVGPGETFEVAFRADNPGVWMDHCHNLEHASVGMMMHLTYEGVSSPYEMGRATPNNPE